MALPYYRLYEWTPEETPAQARLAVAVYTVCAACTLTAAILAVLFWLKERPRSPAKVKCDGNR
jgi:hypothetical protein